MRRTACINCWYPHDESEDCPPCRRTRSECVASVRELGLDVEVPDGPEDPVPYEGEEETEELDEVEGEPDAETPAAEEVRSEPDEPVGPKKRGRKPKEGALPSGVGVRDREAYNKYMKDYRARKKAEQSAKAQAVTPPKGGRSVH